MSNKKFIEKVVNTHNDYRKKHGVSSLKHSKALSSIAQNWADELAATNSFQHSQSSHQGERLGENIAMKWSSRPETYTDVTDQWYSEISMYQFGGEPKSDKAGHFSQVVWKNSKEIGVGQAQASDGNFIVVANYKSAGNVLGRYSENVLPPTSGRVVLPAKPAESSQPERDNSGPASRFPSHTSSSHSNSRNPDHSKTNSSGAKSVLTYTSREGSGLHGWKVTTKNETVTTGGCSERTTMGNNFGDFDKNLSSRFDRLKCGDDDRSTFSQAFSRRDLEGNRFNVNSSTQPKSKNRSQPSSNQSKPQTMSAFIKDSLSAHNGLRAKHGVPPLTQSRDLTDYAQRWAEHLALTGSFQHSDCTLKNGDRLGENIAYKWSSGGDDYTAESSQPERDNSGPASRFPSHTSSSHSNSRNPDHSKMNSSGAKSVLTYTSREGSGLHGWKVTTKKETVTTGGCSERTTMGNNFGDFDKNLSSRLDRLKCGDDDRSTFSQAFSRRDLEGNRFNVNSSTQPKSKSRSQPSSNQSKPQTMSAFIKDSLSAHNGLRAKHGVPPLTQSRDLTDYAQRWAEHLASTGSFQHSDCTLKNGDRLGENIAYKWSSGGDDYTGQAATDQWYSEIQKYDFSGRSISSVAVTGHFTQVVWKGSRELGMGKARGRDGKVIVVASYRPAGNMLGTFQDNVFPPK